MQTKDPINTIPIQQFIQQVKTADAGNIKEIKIPTAQAKALMFSLSIVMANQAGRLEQLIVDNKSSGDETVTINMDGGSSWK